MASNQDYYHPHSQGYANPSSYSNALEQDHDPVVPGGVPQWSIIQPGENLQERAMPNVSLSLPSCFQGDQRYSTIAV